jgi:hypothetical protein
VGPDFGDDEFLAHLVKAMFAVKRHCAGSRVAPKERWARINELETTQEQNRAETFSLNGRSCGHSAKLPGKLPPRANVRMSCRAGPLIERTDGKKSFVLKTTEMNGGREVISIKCHSFQGCAGAQYFLAKGKCLKGSHASNADALWECWTWNAHNG